MEPGHAAGEAGGWCTVARRRSRHGLRGAVQGVQRMGAGRLRPEAGKPEVRRPRRGAGASGAEAEGGGPNRRPRSRGAATGGPKGLPRGEAFGAARQTTPKQDVDWSKEFSADPLQLGRTRPL